MLTMAFGESTRRKTQFQLWYTRIKEDREVVSDNARPCRPSTSTTDGNIEEVKEMILDKRRITIREVVIDVGILIGSYEVILTDA